MRVGARVRGVVVMLDDCATEWGELCQMAEGTAWGKLVGIGLCLVGVVWLYRRGW